MPRARGEARRALRDRALAYVVRVPGTTSAEVAVALGCGRSSALATLQWLRKHGAIECRGKRADAGWWVTSTKTPQPVVDRRSGRIRPATARAIRRGWLLREPCALPEGDVAALSYMAGDLTAKEWAERLGCAPVDVERACAWLGTAAKEAA